MLKIGIIGAGRIGRVHCQSVSKFVDGAQVWAIADPMMNQETAEWAKNLGVKNIYSDYHEILNDKEIDAVLICSSTDTHSKISLEAIAKGKHVFCEKPVDNDVQKIAEVIAALEKTPVKYQVGFNRRFDHNFKAARAAVAAGKIGSLELLKIISRDPVPPPSNYVSCGMFLDMTIHDFDMARFISGSEVEEVFACGGALVDKNFEKVGDIDTAIVTMKLASGAFASIDNSRRASYGYDQRLEAFGSLGQVAVTNDSASTATLWTKDGINAEVPLHFFLERYMNAYVEEINEFVKAIVNDTDVPVGVWDGLKPVLIGLAAKRSLAENRPVKITYDI